LRKNYIIGSLAQAPIISPPSSPSLEILLEFPLTLS
jgi:hypothetical protein